MIDTLGKYKIESELGQGSFATVYRALDTRLERHVALKVLKPFWMSDAQAVARFMQEARLMAKLTHPHIVTIHDVGQAAGRVYLAQQLVNGTSLAMRLQLKALTWSEMLAIVRSVASALDYAHAQGLIHRDIKPQNILLGENSGVFLSDFGLVKATEGSMSLGLSTGGMLGTPNYMAPEQWEGTPVTPATDIYSLACVVAEILTGKVLFSGNSPSVVMKRHLIDGPKFPVTWAKNIPPNINQVLAHGLDQNPTKRFQSASEFVAKLENLTKPTLAANISTTIADTVMQIPKPKKPALPSVAPILKSVRENLSRLTFPQPHLPRVSIQFGKLFSKLRHRNRMIILGVLLLVIFGGGWSWIALSQRGIVSAPPLKIAGASPLVFVSNRTGNTEIYMLDSNRKEIRLTNNPAEDTSPAWSPNHTQVVFSSNRNGHTDIYTWNIKSGELIRITNNKADDTEPVWSPYGRYIAFTSTRSGKREIWIDGAKGFVQVTHSPGTSESWEPAWGENGMLIFTSNRDGKREIYHTAPKQALRITYSPDNTESWEPHWLATGNDLLFVSNRAGKDDIYILSSKAKIIRVTTSTGLSKNISPASPIHSNHIAFASNRSGRFQIYTLIDGKSEQLTSTGSNWSPAW